MDQLTHRIHQFSSILKAKGPDTREFLQGQFSQDLAKLGAGEEVYGLWLDRKGKVVADSFVFCVSEEEFLIASYFCEEGRIYERLDAYLVMEEVEIERLTALSSAVSVFGAEGCAIVREVLSDELPEPGGFIFLNSVLFFWGRRGAVDCLEILVTNEKGEGVRSEILDKLEASGSVAISEEEMERVSIEGGVPQIGRGFGETDLPQEIGLEAIAVSFNKGCYLGQEVMARLHSMGKARKRLLIVGIGGANTDASVELPLDLVDESGKKQGELRAAVYSASGGIGLAIVNNRFTGSVLRAGDIEISW